MVLYKNVEKQKILKLEVNVKRNGVFCSPCRRLLKLKFPRGSPLERCLLHQQKFCLYRLYIYFWLASNSLYQPLYMDTTRIIHILYIIQYIINIVYNIYIYNRYIHNIYIHTMIIIYNDNK